MDEIHNNKKIAKDKHEKMFGKHYRHNTDGGEYVVTQVDSNPPNAILVSFNRLHGSKGNLVERLEFFESNYSPIE